jgi:hypothetical protein
MYIIFYVRVARDFHYGGTVQYAYVVRYSRTCGVNDDTITLSYVRSTRYSSFKNELCGNVIREIEELLVIGMQHQNRLQPQN